MDHHVHEDAAGNRRVLCGWGLRIAGRNAHILHLADLAFFDRFAHRAVVVVVTAVETDLIDELFRGSEQRCFDFFDLFNALIDRLLTEDVLACRDRFQRDLGVQVGRSADQDRIDARIIQDLRIVGVNAFDADGLCPFGDFGLHVRIRDRKDLCVRNAGKDAFCVDLTDAARADDANVNH